MCKDNVYESNLAQIMKEKLRRLWRGSVLVFLTMALLGCASQAESMPDMGQPPSPTATGSCAELDGTDQVRVDVFYDEYGINLTGCVDGTRSIESATLIYLSSCMGNQDMAICRAPFGVSQDSSFGGSVPGIDVETPLGAIELKELIGTEPNVVTCELILSIFNLETQSASLIYQCPPMLPQGDAA